MYTVKQVTHKEASKSEVEQLYLLLLQLSKSITMESVHLALASNQNHILIAMAPDGRIVGTATMAYLHCLTGTRVHIEDVVVDEDYRRKGIANQLMTEAIQRAKAIKAKSIDLTSRPDKVAANQLYQKLGFVQRETNVYRYQQDGQ